MLHNNAGGSTARDDTAVDAPLDEFWRAIKLDVFGTFLGCRFGIPELIKGGGGSVINLSSNVALMGSPAVPPGGATFGALFSFVLRRPIGKAALHGRQDPSRSLPLIPAGAGNASPIPRTSRSKPVHPRRRGTPLAARGASGQVRFIPASRDVPASGPRHKREPRRGESHLTPQGDPGRNELLSAAAGVALAEAHSHEVGQPLRY